MRWVDVKDQTATRAAVLMGIVSLFLSGWAFSGSFQDEDFERQTETRLACLELPGPNDCGADGR